MEDRAVNNSERTHLQYVDDTIVICEVVGEHILTLVIFIIFEAVSGLHINWGKSFIYPVNAVANIVELARKLGAKWVSYQQLTLGVPLGAKSKLKDMEWCNREV